MDWENIIPSIDRILLLTWLIKDFGWMSTNIYLGWPFGITAIIYHALALVYDPRQSFRYYNASFLLWVTGNFIWLTLEYCDEPLSSNIHWGPDVPVGCLQNDNTVYILSMIKLSLFISSLMIQCILYLGIYFKKIPMPRHFDEEIICVNELALLLGKKDVSNIKMHRRLQINDDEKYSKNYHEDHIDDIDIDTLGDDIIEIQLNNTSTNSSSSSNDNDCSQNKTQNKTQKNNKTKKKTIHKSQKHNNINVLNINEEQAALPISTAFVEYTYVIWWIMKDLFWSISTGDLGDKSIEFAIFSESIALFFGTIAFSVYCISAYIYRRHMLSFLDSVTTLFWISANFVWMCGEFFMRYENMQLDDQTQGSDRATRIVATVFFCSGIFIQICVITYMSYAKFRKRKSTRLHWAPGPAHDKVSFNFKKKKSKQFTYSDIKVQNEEFTEHVVNLTDDTYSNGNSNGNNNGNLFLKNISSNNTETNPSDSIYETTLSIIQDNENNNENGYFNTISKSRSVNSESLLNNNNYMNSSNYRSNSHLHTSSNKSIPASTTATSHNSTGHRQSSSTSHTHQNSHENDDALIDDDGEDEVMVLL